MLQRICDKCKEPIINGSQFLQLRGYNCTVESNGAVGIDGEWRTLDICNECLDEIMAMGTKGEEDEQK